MLSENRSTLYFIVLLERMVLDPTLARLYHHGSNRSEPISPKAGLGSYQDAFRNSTMKLFISCEEYMVNLMPISYTRPHQTENWRSRPISHTQTV